ncbi:MAG: hypothetical protein J6X44_00685 [Thermoguttaceae bacterium]|nr:hypothetical protein [Thermoguttaceae bacterium]
MERQKRLFVGVFSDKFGANAKLPDNWAEGRSGDKLEALTMKLFRLSTLQEALDLFR